MKKRTEVIIQKKIEEQNNSKNYSSVSNNKSQYFIQKEKSLNKNLEYSIIKDKNHSETFTSDLSNLILDENWTSKVKEIDSSSVRSFKNFLKTQAETFKEESKKRKKTIINTNSSEIYNKLRLERSKITSLENLAIKEQFALREETNNDYCNVTNPSDLVLEVSLKIPIMQEFSLKNKFNY